MDSTTKLILLSFGTLLLASHCTCQDIAFTCDGTLQHAKGESGYIQINRSLPTCLFSAADGNKFFVLRTDNLELSSKDSITITPGGSTEKSEILNGPIDSDYLALGIDEPRFEVKLDQNPNLSPIMLVQYFQTSRLIPIDGDKVGSKKISTIGLDEYSLSISKTSADPIHVKVSGSQDSYGHHLISGQNGTIPVQEIKPPKNVERERNVIFVELSPVRQDCSKSYQDKAEESHEISGPEAANINAGYRCTNLFKTNSKGQAHFDVDFTNFLDIVDDKDELTIDDGVRALKVNRFAAKHYYQTNPIISFLGPRLAVIYDSPQVIKPRGVFKLTVKAQTVGGVVEQNQALSLPTAGSVRYTLRPQNNDATPVLEVKGQLTGTNLVIYGNQNKFIKFESDSYLPPIIALNQGGQDTVLEFLVKSKVQTTFNFKQENDCGGTFFGPSGSISIKGLVASKTCYWLMGSKSVLNIDYQSLEQQDSCLEIYSLSQEKPFFTRCNIGSSVVLPPFLLGPAYLSLKTTSNSSRFDASISKPVDGQVQSTTGMQTRYSSTGYPTSYVWSPFPESFSIDATNSPMVLSFPVVDIRLGEKLTVNSIEVTNKTHIIVGDLDVSKKNSTVQITRSLATSDFGVHKGYSIVASRYQTILKADMTKTNIRTPKNLTSLLLQITAAAGKRLAYNITNLDKSNSEYEMHVIDSRSVIGREVYKEEFTRGSTTSNTLLVSVYANKANKTLPEFNVTYSELACNKTSDLLCDQSTRCVPVEKLCKGKSYCSDKTDLAVVCSGSPMPAPQVISNGYSGATLFFMAVLMFSMGIMAALYGPTAYKSVENRFRANHYTTFTSTE